MPYRTEQQSKGNHTTSAGAEFADGAPLDAGHCHEEGKAAAAPDLATADLTLAGKAAVRAHLIAPLDTLGLSRPRGMTAAIHAAGIEALVDRLSYMTAENLTTLADVVASQAALAKGVWPAPILIEGWANGLQKRVWQDSDLMRSWLASIEGPIARAGGYLVPLFRFLRTRRVPPAAYELRKQIMEVAERDNRLRAVYSERIAKGTASPDERAWLAAWLRDEQTALDIVASGDARRAAKAAAQEGGNHAAA